MWVGVADDEDECGGTDDWVHFGLCDVAPLTGGKLCTGGIIVVDAFAAVLFGGALPRELETEKGLEGFIGIVPLVIDLEEEELTVDEGVDFVSTPIF